MFGDRLSPFASMQQLNLDWILTKIKGMLRFLPDDGAVGQILRRTSSGAEWSDESTGGVSSVNGQTGDVVLDASDVGALPDSYTAPVTSVNSQTGAVNIDASSVGLGNVDNVQQYSASNPPPYPVTSVNNTTGSAVVFPPYYVCNTGAAMVNKLASPLDSGLPNFEVKEGVSVIVYFTDTNSATNPTLSLSNDTASSQLPIMQYGTTAAGTAAATTAWNVASPVLLTCNGTAWIMNKGYNTNTTYTITDVVCTTSASTAAKTATGTYFSLAGSENKLFEITFRYTNTKASKITLNIASTGVKDVWLDGAVTSASNYSIKAGHYICLYDAANDCYQLFSNGRMQADIIGTASGNYSASNPPPYPVTSVNGQTGDVVVSASSISYDLLWSNPVALPTTFAPQTIALDLSGYDFWCVECEYNDSTDRRTGRIWYPVEKTPNKTGSEYQVIGVRLNNNYTASRSFAHSNTTGNEGIVVSAGYYNGAAANNYLIPLLIYGIKL